MPTTTTKYATEKQLNFARNLYRQLDQLGVADSHLEVLAEAVTTAKNDRAFMSQIIDGLIGTRDAIRRGELTELVDPDKAPKPQEPAPTATPDVPEGRYAYDNGTQTIFVQVDRPTEGRWAGYVFVKRLVGAPGDFAKYPVRNRDERADILRIISEDPQAAAIAFGQLVGVCGVCGSPLTNEESREYGIGPVCRAKTGW